ncbi:MAG TPA: O-antigen ligase family protein [Candidatus Acidoferrales bacterium]|nr:O-antigen ligase family protein [Candidatus Acidoferrales bacterium]
MKGHNHFAGLLEMILPLAVGLAFYHSQSARRRSRGSAVRAALENLNEPAILKSLLLLFAATILLVAIVFSFSRMGMISAFVSLVVMGAVVWAGGRRSLLPSALILVLLAGGVAAVAWVGVAPVVERFEQLPQNEPLAAAGVGRVAAWRDTLQLVRAHPLAGAGLGCFRYAFTAVQSTQLTYLVDHAHNDYLEFAAELGIPGAALFFAPLFWIAFRTLRAALRARSRLARSLALGSLGASVALLVHSAADFNLYIPANALVFAVILAIGYAASLDDPAAPLVTAPPSG